MGMKPHPNSLEARVARLAAGKSAAYCNGMAALCKMGPLSARDRRVANAWERQAAAKTPPPREVTDD